MANELQIIGLSSFDMGAVGAGDTMGTSLTNFNGTKLGTFNLNFAEPGISDMQIEESDDPLFSIVNPVGKEFSLELIDLTLSEVVTFTGGTYTAGAGGLTRNNLTLPDTFPTILQSVKLTSKNGAGEDVIFSFAKCQVIASITSNPTKTDAFGLNVKFKVLKAAVPVKIEVGGLVT